VAPFVFNRVQTLAALCEDTHDNSIPRRSICERILFWRLCETDLLARICMPITYGYRELSQLLLRAMKHGYESQSPSVWG